jgi:hypothetical protein
MADSVRAGVNGRRQQVTQPDSDQAEHYGKQRVGPGAKPLTFLRQI